MITTGEMYILPVLHFLPPAMELRQGNVFTPVYQSFCSQGGVCLWPVLGSATQSQPQTDTSTQCMLGYNPLPSAYWDTYPPCSACCDTVNKQAVRIPLECILVT